MSTHEFEIEFDNTPNEHEIEFEEKTNEREIVLNNEIDPTVPEHVKKITKEDIEKWNNPEIPKTDIELLKEIKPESIEEELKDNQVYNGNAIHDLARLFGMTLEELTKTLPVLLTEYDGQQHEENEVYNANAVTSLIDLMALTLPNLIKEFDLYGEYSENDVYTCIAINQLMEIFGFEIMQIQEYFEELYDAVEELVEKQPLVVTATFTLATQKLTNISHYYDEIKQARDNGQDVKLKVTIAESGNVATADISVLDVSKKSAFFYPIMRTNIGAGTEIYFFDVEIRQSTGSLGSYVLQATALGE